MNKRIVLVGPTASGKNYLRDKFESKGFTFDVSYTTREPRLSVGEKEGVEYHFITDEKFDNMVLNDELYEKVEYNGFKYGTGRMEWETKDVFIMEPHGVDCITEEDKESCFIIYIDPPLENRVERMKNERKWTEKQISDRLETDGNKFGNFIKYDMKITTPEF